MEAQLRNPHSLLWWMRRVLALRKSWRALGEGHVEFLAPQNRKVLAYMLRHEQETLLVVANLSRFPQPVELDLSAFKGRVPFELFGRTPFPAIGELPFFLTPGPHGFYWFSLEVAAHGCVTDTGQRATEPSVELSVEQDWEESAFGAADGGTGTGRCRAPARCELVRLGRERPQERDAARTRWPLPLPSANAFLTLWQVEYAGADTEWYAAPLAFAAESEAARLRPRSLSA